ncbi:TOBE domain-containing protein [Nitrosophilus labii]|uniref:TOBE domain-containing protein n=1 Tax=Nitrosophilus labii TaxID=2706014 RepID=UPI001656A190|nr:TOBE domain-containing protein [Nitrosophilus labii]
MKGKIEGRFWIKKDGKNFLGSGRVELLKNIEKLGSISKAARAMKMSYKAAWDAVEIMNNLSEEPILEKVSGGKGGGGSRLTEYGKRLIKDFEELKKQYKDFLESLENFDKRVFGVKISARNRLLCKIEKISFENDVCTIFLTLRDSLSLTSKITVSAANELELKEGDKVIAIIKSTSIKIYDEPKYNSLKTRVTEIKHSEQHSTLTLKTQNGYTLNVLTKRCNLNIEDEIYAQIDPEDILIGV